jgi:hypothetical protein
MLTVLMPSRGREAQATEAYEAFLKTRRLADTQMVVVLDSGEPGYKNVPVVYIQHEGGMGAALNGAAKHVANDGDTTLIGFVGDDHRFLTPGWDVSIAAANDELGGGIVYGNDLIRGEELPSAAFLDARIVRALGWMALPGATHLYFDDTWRELGKRMGRLKYLSDVHIEHRHPIAGKADWDENYLRVNAQAVYDHDRVIYSRWMTTQINNDAAKALAALQ